MAMNEPLENTSPTITSRGSFELIEVEEMSIASSATSTELATPSEHARQFREPTSTITTHLDRPKDAPLPTSVADNAEASFLDKIRAIREEVDSATHPELLKALQCYLEKAIKDVDLDAPSWFLDNCVKTADELKTRGDILSIRRNDNNLTSSLVGCDSLDGYEVDAVVYDPLLSIYRAQNEHAPFWTSVFRHDAVYLRYPAKQQIPMRYTGPASPPSPSIDHGHVRVPPPPPPPPLPLPNGTNAFLSHVVEQFAKDSQADLITLTLEDLRDLAAHFAKLLDITVTPYNTIRQVFGLDPDRDDDSPMFHHLHPGGGHVYHTPPPPPPPCLPHPYPYRRRTPRPDGDEASNHPCSSLRAIFQSTLQKSSSSSSVSKTRRSPLVVHMPNAQDLMCALGDGWLDALRGELGRLREAKVSVILLFTSPEQSIGNFIWPERIVMHAAGIHPMKFSLCVAPTKSASQISLFTKHQAEEKSYAPFNLRKLQYAMRQARSGCLHQMLHPYSLPNLWETEDAPSPWTERELTTEEVETLVLIIGDRCDGVNIKKEIQAFYKKQDILKPWWPALQEHKDGHDPERNPSSKWFKFPEHVQKVVKQIESELHTWDYERKFLDTLVNLQVVAQPWSSIAVDHDIKHTIAKQIYGFFGGQDNTSHLFQNARIGGALLYGPPGTGKTMMARILVRECEFAMLSVSIADIEHHLIGETSKHIKALFNLARMLRPCVIFVDDADVLFHARLQGDPYELPRSRIVQLFAEMDKNSQMKDAPFVILATSLPTHLDRAVLRRVPSLLHVGLPPAAVRGEIFNIYLRDEDLDSDVNTTHLAARTAGYSGSDIKTLCLQADRLRRPVVLRKGCPMPKYRQEHFQSAIRKFAPTVSQAALEEIRAFAAQHDLAALEHFGLKRMLKG